MTESEISQFEEILNLILHRFRAPKNTRGPSGADTAFGFIDGDFLEQYLTLSPDDLKKVKKGSSAPEQLKLSSEQIVKILEQLQSLH